MADFKLNRIRYNWRGDWSAETNYIKDDVVRYGSSTFVVTETHTSSSSFYNDFGLDPTDLTVTVARNAGNTADIFYLNGNAQPTLDLRQGRTYHVVPAAVLFFMFSPLLCLSFGTIKQINCVVSVLVL